MNSTSLAKPTVLPKLQSLVRTDLARVDDVILSHIDSTVPLIPQMARHIIAAGGKRLRPGLTLLAARLCGYEGIRHIHLAACVEFIHTATLLHDDVVDESALRRGSATANEVWGNKSSVLVGDFLLSRAFQLMVADGSLKVLKILSDASAIIAQGEVMQLMTANDITTTQKQYFNVISGKTATLFAAACELGAVVTGQEAQEAPLREIGLSLGIAFQIMDDALDYSAEQQTLGKSVGDDFREGKMTLPVIISISDGTEEEKQFWQRTLGDQILHEGDLEHAMQIIDKYHAIDRSITIAEQYCDKARSLLAPFADQPEKEAFFEVIDFCIQRSF